MIYFYTDYRSINKEERTLIHTIEQVVLIVTLLDFVYRYFGPGLVKDLFALSYVAL